MKWRSRAKGNSVCLKGMLRSITMQDLQTFMTVIGMWMCFFLLENFSSSTYSPTSANVPILNHSILPNRLTSIPRIGFFVLENFSSSIHFPALANAPILNHQYPPPQAYLALE